jgi:ParB-like nuclease domain
MQPSTLKALIHDISDNGGLIDPLVVRDKDFVVLEGNSRLAAYRFLASKDPIKWAKAKCTILPADIDEKLVFALLGQYHVKGKKDWVPYEKAGFLYRRHKQQKVVLSTIAAELSEMFRSWSSLGIHHTTVSLVLALRKKKAWLSPIKMG